MPLRHRPGFTLVELLVVVGILLLIAAVTVTAINTNISGDRIRGSARQVQSYLEGARGRAAYGGNATTQGATYQCGVRFIRDANNPSLCTSMQFVEIDAERGAITGGVFGIQYDSSSSPKILVGTANGSGAPETSKTHWVDRYQQGLIYDYQIILLSGRRYQIDASSLAGGNEEIILRTPYAGTITNTAPASPGIYAVPPGSEPKYNILLAPQPMANQEPRPLGTGVVLDLSLSKGLQYFTSNSLLVDVMFSPRGTVVGPLAGTGMVEFVVGDLEDSLKGIPLPSSGNVNPNPAPKRERMIISLTPQTGKTAVHPIYFDPAGAIADPYRYAETGEVAAQ